MDIFLPSGEIIYSKETAVEWLESLGLNCFDIDELGKLIQPKDYEWLEERVQYLTEISDGFEREGDGYFCALRDCYIAISDLVEEMKAAPKNKSKAYFGKKLELIAQDLSNFV